MPTEPENLLRVENITRGTNLGDAIEEASIFLTRLKGLMGRQSLLDRHGMLLRNTPSIHMCFMKFPIDVIFVDRNGVVAKTVSSVQPWIGMAFAESGVDALELPVGTIEKTGTVVGDRLLFSVVQSKC